MRRRVRHVFGLCALLLVTLPARASSPESAAEALIESGHFKRARALVERLARTEPDDASSAYLLSRVRLAFGDVDAALASAERAVRLEPATARYHFQLARVCGEMAERSGALRQISLARRFRREAETAVRLDPAYLEARMGLVEYYVRAPRLIGGDRARASEMAAEIARRDASEGFLAAKFLLRGKQDVAEEERLDAQAAERNPGSYEIQMLLSDLYASDARRDDLLSERHAREALRLKPDRAGGYVNLARQLVRRRRLGELDALLAAAEANVPDDLSPFFHAGQALLATGQDLPRAEGYLRKYLAQEPEPPAPSLALAHARLGLLLEKEGRPSEAAAEIELARRSRPDLPKSSWELGRSK